VSLAWKLGTYHARTTHYDDMQMQLEITRHDEMQITSNHETL